MKPRELKKWREQQFLSQANVAVLLGVHANTVLNWEKGATRMPPSIELALEAIAQQRAPMLRRLRLAKEERAHRVRLKMAEQHPEHYAKLLDNIRKARAAKAQLPPNSTSSTRLADRRKAGFRKPPRRPQ